MSLIQKIDQESFKQQISIYKSNRESRNQRASRRIRTNVDGIKMLNDISFKKNITGHWNFEETSKYLVFLKVYHQNFQIKNLRRSEKIFKQMSRFINTRTPDQCRSHHQKMEKKCVSQPLILSYLENSCTVSASLQQSLTSECLKLRKQISEQSDSVQLRKHEQQKIKNQENSNDNKLQIIDESTDSHESIDISKYYQNGYYVMPIFIVPCSQLYFSNLPMKKTFKKGEQSDITQFLSQ